MLTILPVNDNETLGICTNENTTVLLCKEDECDKGYIAFEQNGYVLNIVGFEVFGADEIKGASYVTADALLRSMCSYAMNHSCFYLECSKKELFGILKHFPFENINEVLKSDLNKILRKCNH